MNIIISNSYRRVQVLIAWLRLIEHQEYITIKAQEHIDILLCLGSPFTGRQPATYIPLMHSIKNKCIIDYILHLKN